MQRLLRSLWITGLWLKCPVCEQGNLFATYFNMNKICPHCGVRFERETGEVTGGMSVSIVLTAFIFLLGYGITEVLTNWPLWVHFAIWMPFAILFPIIFYRYSRSLWVVFLYVTDSKALTKDATPYQDTELSMIDAFRNIGNDQDS